MKKIFATAVIVISLMACGNGAGNSTADTSATTIGDTTGNTVDTSSINTGINTGDSTGINRDTVRSDRTRIKKNVDTTRRRSDTLR
jgi:hypothetical protein